MLPLLRFLAIALAIYFIYRLIISTIRYLTQDRGSDSRHASEPPPQNPQPKEPPEYRDIKDARFKDLPPGPKNPS